jgi:creatinine amidohydrolase/Fe(II)-dependent formamide hydrolase-like protein
MPDNKVIIFKNDKSVGDNSLASLQVFERLEVGPVKLEPKRLIAPYRLLYDGKEDTVELIYRYEEDVFAPSEGESRNLASMIAAQVAINYGLFCRCIVFHGTYDEHDHRFIRDMAENTAREILVKKFLEPNPFLVPEAVTLSPLSKGPYLSASLEFHHAASGQSKKHWQLWPTMGQKHAILSSGGKDSLLSFGLLSEMEGHDVHPIFVNESGRHWFTALNSYRYFKEHVRNTARVWVNSDRVFNWMLRHMPFIRKDFSLVRSDEYPVRLWTVAVFLFGALPLLRKRGTGRLIIGDEFDTTRRAILVKDNVRITHYDGLYDQSRYFDNTLSRYYLRKGWSISQFSVLRPLSELLIQKVLANRYPDLLRQQMSCHAAHITKGRVFPCGKCEKCRRIVSMLVAIDSDPTCCGYSEHDISDCLKEFAAKGVHQESTDAQHLTYILLQKGLIKLLGSRKKLAREHRETEKLRFDPSRSPMVDIPRDLRQPLYTIYLRYARGAVYRKGRSWIDFDPLTDEALSQPYPFEINRDRPAHVSMEKKNLPPSSPGFLWGEMAWPEASERLEKLDIALLPVGSIEQHGPHLPLDTDAFDADYLAQRVAEACSDPKPFVLPLISYGVSYHHNDFKGTISISNDTLSQLVYEIGMSAAHNGIKKLVIINGHGGNSPALNNAAQKINRDAKIFVCVDTGETSDVDILDFIETPNDVHGGEIETSTSLAVRPHLVTMEKAVKLIPHFSSRYLDFTAKRSVPWYAYTRKVSQNGVMGDPTKASAEKGEKIWRIMIAHLVALVEELKSMTLDEIYQLRY